MRRPVASLLSLLSPSGRPLGWIRGRQGGKTSTIVVLVNFPLWWQATLGFDGAVPETDVRGSGGAMPPHACRLVSPALQSRCTRLAPIFSVFPLPSLAHVPFLQSDSSIVLLSVVSATSASQGGLGWTNIKAPRACDELCKQQHSNVLCPARVCCVLHRHGIASPGRHSNTFRLPHFLSASLSCPCRSTAGPPPTPRFINLHPFRESWISSSVTTQPRLRK